LENIILPRNKKLKQRSRDLRNNSTIQENRLWYNYLRNYTVHFYRQRIIGNYIVDFYCARAKIVIEIDGTQHYELESIAYDKHRTNQLNCLGLSVLRFSNNDINDNFDSVCQLIDNEVKKIIQQQK
jgi:very-short-patch-repair endonuclease